MTTDSNRALVERARDSLKHALAPFKPTHTKAEAEQVLADLDTFLPALVPAQDVARVEKQCAAIVENAIHQAVNGDWEVARDDAAKRLAALFSTRD